MYIHKITQQGKSVLEESRKTGQGVVLAKRRGGTAGRYWKLEAREVRRYKERSKLVYRSPLHHLTPKNSNSHVLLDWGDDLA